MNRDRLYLGFVTALIVTVVIYASYGLLNSEKKDTHYVVSVIVSNSGSDRWNAFKEGLNQGADEAGLYLNVVSAPAFSRVEEEYGIIGRELENGADGVIVALCDTSDLGGRLSELVSEDRVVLIDSDLDLEGGHALVQPDAKAIGEAIAQMILDEKKTAGKTIGVLTGNQQTLAGRKRLEGFCKKIKEAGREIRFCAETDKQFQEEMKATPDILAALESDAMEMALDLLTEGGQTPDCSLYGEGRSERAVYYLDRGHIQGMIVPDEYAMGYESAQLIQKQLEHTESSTTQIETGFISVTKEKMYDKEAEKILFPVVH